MPDGVHANRFSPRYRFVRSVHIERDFEDVSALKDYIVTAGAEQALVRILGGLGSKSTQRAWRLTGDYGSGKSALAVALANIVSVDKRKLPPQLRPFHKRRVMLPVLLTGSRAPLAEALLERLLRSFDALDRRGREPGFVREARATLEHGSAPEIDEVVVSFIRSLKAYLAKKDIAGGVLVVIDELGKFLEYAVLNPHRQDVYLLQILAEEASRSGPKSPFVVVGILHQGFSAYVARTAVHQQKEWEKVAGRYEEVVFQPSIEQSLTLAGSALRSRIDDLTPQIRKAIANDLSQICRLGWYGTDAPPSTRLLDIYPLHPSVFPVLVRLFQRYGQNERSLFSFLLSDEPFGLQAFAASSTKKTALYRISDLYDYLKANFDFRLRSIAGTRWEELETLVASYVVRHDHAELCVLKTVAVLNILDDQGLLGSDALLALAIADSKTRAKHAVSVLRDELHLLYTRGAAGGYCLWPYTSVDILERYSRAERVVGGPQETAKLAVQYMANRAIVARRHYIETGNLRYFRVRYVPMGIFAAQLAEDRSVDPSDGHIMIALCESPEQRLAALEIIRSRSEGTDDLDQLLLAVSPPLEPLAPLFHDYRCWTWVQKNVPELNQDTFAAKEVSRLVDESHARLRETLNEYLGLRHDTQTMDMVWYWRGEPQTVGTGREFLRLLSDICDEVYSSGPCVHNELVNRGQLSSAAAAARMRLIERIFSQPHAEFLGLDPQRKPPEMSMYLSVLAASKVHRSQANKGWVFARPTPKSDPCNLRPSLDRITELLNNAKEKRVPVTQLMQVLQEPPYGVRDGLLLLLLAVVCAIDDHRIALYEEGSFVRSVTGEHFARMVKFPEYYDLQYFKITGVRSVLFQQLLIMLDASEHEHATNVLQVVRPLLRFAGQLPQYALKTKRLPEETKAVRDALLNAREPTALVFDSLPRACGYEPFTNETHRTAKAKKEVAAFLSQLRRALDALRSSYPELLTRLSTYVKTAFGSNESVSISTLRSELAQRATAALVTVREPQLKGLCLRFADEALTEQAWLEALGSYVCSKPPKIWFDSDESRFVDEFTLLVERFHRAESLGFGKSTEANTRAVRVSLTRLDGSHVDQVVAASTADLERVAALEDRLAELLRHEQQRVGLVAISRLMWKAMELHTGDDTTS